MVIEAAAEDKAAVMCLIHSRKRVLRLPELVLLLF